VGEKICEGINDLGDLKGVYRRIILEWSLKE
jgi:hypothetical protein